jgi:hypothetical protein
MSTFEFETPPIPESDTERDPSVRLSSLVDWLNEHTDISNEARSKLEGFLGRRPELADDPRITAKLGELMGRGEMLGDFKGLLMGLTAERSGELDDISYLLESYEDTDNNNIDKP